MLLGSPPDMVHSALPHRIRHPHVDMHECILCYSIINHRLQKIKFFLLSIVNFLYTPRNVPLLQEKAIDFLLRL